MHTQSHSTVDNQNLHLAIEQRTIEILSEFKNVIQHYARSDVATTAHAVDQKNIDVLNWTQKLLHLEFITTPPKAGYDRFVELERTSTSVYCLLVLMYPESEEAYLAFTAAQRDNYEIKESEILSKERFLIIQERAKQIIENDSDKANVLARLIIYSDLGKSPGIKEAIKKMLNKAIQSIDLDMAPVDYQAELKKFQLNLNLDPDDLMTEVLTRFTDAQISEVLPDFALLSDKAKAMLKEVYPLMRACYGHLYFLERGKKTLRVVATALQRIPLERRRQALDLVFLAQEADGFGARGQQKIRGSVTCVDNFAQGYHLMYQTFCLLGEHLNKSKDLEAAVQTSFDFYFNERARWMGLTDDFQGKEFVVRLGCTLRAYTPTMGTVLVEEFKKRSPEHQELLMGQLGFDERGGLEAWTKTHFIATAPQNIARPLLGENMRMAVARALDVAICLAKLVKSMTQRYPNAVFAETPAVVLRGFVDVVGKTCNPDEFDPENYCLNPSNGEVMTREKYNQLLGLQSLTRNVLDSTQAPLQRPVPVQPSLSTCSL